MPNVLRALLVVLALAAFAPARSQAQERARPDSAQADPQQEAMMRQQMRAMMPMMSDMMRQVAQSTMAALAEPETAQNLARFTRNYYEALVSQGFTEAQALQIVASMGFPTLPSL